jgi:hypothetical protein
MGHEEGEGAWASDAGGRGPATQGGRWAASRLKREKGVDFLFIYLFIFLFSLLFPTIRCNHLLNGHPPNENKYIPT